MPASRSQPGSERGVRIRVGIDMVGIDRVGRLVDENVGVLDEVFSPREQEYCLAKRATRNRHLAGRFAAKEAVLKAFGTGLATRMRWTDVEILNERSGRPRVELHGEVAAFADRGRLSDLDVTVSHSEGLAISHAVAVWMDGDALPPD